MAQSHSPTRIPESMGAKEIGAYMGGLREHFKLTQLDVSQRLHIRPRYVSAIEEGRFELMPGKVYARGYIHSYAEFLGLDADQVVAQCFASEPATAPVVAPNFTPPMAKMGTSLAGNWRGLGIAGVVAILALLLFTQLTGDHHEEAATAPVPEAMLESVRTGLMPNAQNHDCLLGVQWLGCFFADNTVLTIMRMQSDTRPLFVSDADLERMEEDADDD